MRDKYDYSKIYLSVGSTRDNTKLILNNCYLKYYSKGINNHMKESTISQKYKIINYQISRNFSWLHS